MNKVLFLFSLLIGSLAFSQGRFIYELKFKIDSTKRENIQSEIFNLDIANGKSFFYAMKYAQYDSIAAENRKTGLRSPKPDPLLDYQILKNYKENKVFFREMVGADIYEVPDDAPQKWKITTEKKTLANLPVQMATTQYKGRTWTAWFSKDIALSDGPYKFRGLPGLILEVYDAKDDYHFTIAQIKKKYTPFEETLTKNLGFKTFKIDYKTYLKKKKEIDDNPALTLTQLPGMTKEMLDQSMIDDYVKSYRLRKKSRNNDIELLK